MAEDKFTHDNLRELIAKMKVCVDEGEKFGTITRYDIARVLPRVEALVTDLCRDRTGAY
mgnify:FL=1|jgi:hypothetical protein